MEGETFHCVVYGSSDVQRSGCYNNAFRLPDKKGGIFPFKYCVPDSWKTMPYFLHFDVFTLGPDSDANGGNRCLRPFAHGFIAFHHLWHPVDVTLCDIESRPQCQLIGLRMDEQSLEDFATKRKEQNDSRETEMISGPMEANQIIVQLQSKYKNLGLGDYTDAKGKTWSDVGFTYYHSYFGNIPTLAFAYNTTQIAHCEDSSNWFVWHVMRVAGYALGLEIGDFASQSVETKGDWLAEMCSLYFRGQVYCHDTARRPRNLSGDVQYDVLTDLWTNMNSFPASESYGYDCEDGAAWILEFVYFIDAATNFGACEPLLKLKEFVGMYTPYMVIGQLMTEPPCHHAYVMLLDNDKNFRERPPIVLESTAYVQGTFSRDRCGFDSRPEGGVVDKHANATQIYRNLADFTYGTVQVPKPSVENIVFAYMHSSTLFTAEPHIAAAPAKYRRVCKTRAPVEAAIAAPLYGRVWSMICPCRRSDGAVVQYWLADQDQRKGADFNDVISNSRKAVWHEAMVIKKKQPLQATLVDTGCGVGDTTRAKKAFDTSDLERMMREFPRSKLPQPPAGVEDEQSTSRNEQAQPSVGEKAIAALKDRSGTKFFIRGMDLERDREQWEAAFKKLHQLDKRSSKFVFAPAKVNITDTISFYVVNY
jgi:hypothetical protein